KYGAPADKIQVIYSMVPKVFFEAYLPLKPKDKSFIKILSVGRPHWIKGYPYAIHAMAKLKKLGYNIQYQIVGIDQPDEELLFLISELGLNQEVTLHEEISQLELITLMQSKDIMLLS